MRFLGELYSYKHIDSSVVFETLYLVIVFGHGTPEVSESLLQQRFGIPLPPPISFFLHYT
jgi:hypothetical protein